MTLPQHILDKIANNEYKATIENWICTIKEPIPTFQPAESAFIPYCIHGNIDDKSVETSRILYKNLEDKDKWVYTNTGSLYRLGKEYQLD